MTTPRHEKSKGKDIAVYWDGQDALVRLKMILNYRDLFLSLGLITPREMEMVSSVSETEWVYLINRLDVPFFTGINIKTNINTQENRNKLKAALRAVFL